MNLALWIVAIVLAVAFAGSGLMKLFIAKLVTPARAGHRTSARPASD